MSGEPGRGGRGALALLEASAASPVEGVRARVLHALARFPLDRDAWLGIGHDAVALADVEPGDGERRDLLQALAALPLRSARRRLERIAADAEDPDCEVAAELVASPEERTRQRVAELVDELARDPLGGAVEELACLPIERFEVDRALFDPAVVAESPDSRLWAAVAVGRLGDLEPVVGVLGEIRAGRTPTFMWGDPWSAYDHLARARPLPETLREHLLALEDGPDATERDPGLFLGALTGTRDADGNPIDERQPATDTHVAPTEPVGDEGADADRGEHPGLDPLDVARSLLRSSRSSRLDEHDPAVRAALGRLPADVAGHVVTELVQRVSRSRRPGDELAGNRVMTIVEALPPGFQLPVERVVATYLDAPQPRMNAGQFCFALSRADPDVVLTGFAHLLVPGRRHPLRRLRHAPRAEQLLDLLDGVATMSSCAYGPRIGAGPPTPPAVDVPPAYYEDETQMVGAEPPPEPAAVGAEPPPEPAPVGAQPPPPPEPEAEPPPVLEPEAAPPPPAPSPPEPAPVGAQPPVVDREALVDVVLPQDDGRDARLTQSFVTGRRHRIDVWIGHPQHARPTTLSSGTALDERLIAREPGRFTELEVTLAHRERIETKPLYLPNERSESSRPCELDLLVGADERIVSATIVVSQQRRAIAQFVLLGPASPEVDASPLGPIVLQQQVLARSYEQAGPSSNFEATVVRPSGDAPHVLLSGGSSAVVAPWVEGVRDTVRIVAARLYDVARAMAAGDGGSERDWCELLRLLAAQGTRLHSWLVGNGYGDLATSARIQLLDADPTEPLPVEIVYDRGGVADGAVPCPNWATALERGTCDGCGAEPAFRSRYICPLGFWGLSKVIERQTGTGDPPRLGRLHPLGSVLLAASSKGVRDEDYERTVDALRDVLGADPATASSWEEWPELIRRHEPTMIVVLPHQDRDPALEVDYLEIGVASRLRAGEVSAALVKRPDGPDPVVLLLGCRTADASVSYQNFVAEFRRNGAAIVVGTLATILGQDAAPIAQQFVRELAGPRGAPAADALTAVGFGEAMRTVRRRMVADGNAAALGLIAFGDSDWQVEVGP